MKLRGQIPSSGGGGEGDLSFVHLLIVDTASVSIWKKAFALAAGAAQCLNQCVLTFPTSLLGACLCGWPAGSGITYVIDETPPVVSLIRDYINPDR